MTKMCDGLLMFCSILNDGSGSKGMQLANELGALSSTVLLGKGIISNVILNLLGITGSRKEILWAIIETEKQQEFLKRFSDKFHYDKPNHGIAFSIPLVYFYKANTGEWRATKGVKDVDYDSIYVIVNKGSIDEVIAAAEAAGSTGGTVLHGRGTGKAEKIKLFNIDIEPEKEILVILSQAHKTEEIVKSIADQMDISERGKGIIFVSQVKDTVGLYVGEE